MAEPARSEPQEEPLLRVENLTKHYPGSRAGLLKRTGSPVKAVDGVSFSVGRGETLGLVGESGCGKSTVAKTLMRLVEPTSGHAYFKGQDLFGLSRRELRSIRPQMQLIFQDPYASLNGRMTANELVAEPWLVHRTVASSRERDRRAGELLERVGLSANQGERYPHEFSGGQRQRIGIARALASEPDIIICDEPVSALDVSVQAQIMNLLRDLQGEFGLSYIFISHDLSVVAHLCHRVAVMYLGKVVETGTQEELFETATHPYTQALLSAVLPTTPQAADGHDRIRLEGEPPNPAHPPEGCNFRPRCWKAENLCQDLEPDLIDRAGHGHPSACHFPEVADPRSIVANATP